MSPLGVNQLFRIGNNGPIERTLWTDLSDGGLFSIEIDNPNALPTYKAGGYLKGLAQSGQLELVDVDPWANLLLQLETDAGYREKRDKRWNLIQPLVIRQPEIFHGSHRGKMVAELERTSGSTRKTIYGLMKRYWQRGLSPNALLPDYNRCGAPNQEKPETTVKRGRPPRVESGANVTIAVRKIILRSIATFYATNKTMRFSDAYTEMLRVNFSTTVIDGQTGRSEQKVRLDAPTKWQFRYWYEKESKIYEVKRQRVSPRKYNKDMRGVIGTSAAEVSGPFSRYQIDATIVDLYLVSRTDRSKIIGRPVLYVVIDVFSRMITGIHVGLEGPSWVGAMEALSNSASSKVEYCRRFGIDIDESQWPCFGLPEAILADRGEMLSDQVETLINNFGVRVENTPPFRADWKGIVEQRFRLIQAAFGPYTPGYVEPDFQERGAEDYRLSATLDIDQFTSIMILLALYFNESGRLEGYDRTAAMIKDGVQPVPTELWHWGIANCSGRPRVYPEELLRRALLPSAEATVTPYGIKFYGLFYSNTYAIEKYWFDRARQSGSFKVKISYDPRNMDHVYVHGDRGEERFIAADLTDRSRAYRGMTLWEVDQQNQATKVEAGKHYFKRRDAEVTVKSRIDGIVAEAKSQQPDMSAMSKRERTAKIKDNRAEERSFNQKRDALRPERPAQPPASVIPLNPSASGRPRRPTIADFYNAASRGADDEK